MTPTEINFLRQRSYKLIRELGAGACGRTLLLHDPEIDEQVVCKKYAPASESWREKLFENFLTEIKVLYHVYHPNIVRIFNCHVFRDRYAGYIVMEYVEGTDIDTFLAAHPEQIDSVFAQTISGFRHLEENRILHRDIRPLNIIVRDDGVVKIIDFGFGKEIGRSADFDKSINLNWWCETPNEFAKGRYDFTTEVYFIGKLFEAAIRDREIDSFKYLPLLAKMCHKDPGIRITSFVDIDQAIAGAGLSPDDFTDEEINAYRRFSGEADNALTKIESSAQFESDVAKIELQLDQAYRSCLLEVTVPDAALVFRCVIRGGYYYQKKGICVQALKDFVNLLKSCTKAKKNIVISNLQTKLNASPRYSTPLDEDVPF